MRYSWRLGAVAGIGLYVHATFLLLLAYIGVLGYRDAGARGAIAAIVFVVAVFAIVVLHELGHALTARRFGIPTRDITLLPIGGVARLERMPREPKQELLIAIAGPAVNVVLAGLCWAILVASGGLRDLAMLRAEPAAGFFSRAFVAQLLEANVWLVLFNLVPAFPMDGGRVLRAILAWKTGDYPRATSIAARIGQALAIVFGLVGLVENPFLVFIALFVWLGAASEAAAVRTTASLDGITTGAAMITDFRVLAPFDSIGHAARLLLSGFQQDFPVIDRGVLVGVLTRAALVKAIGDRSDDALVGDAMLRSFPIATPDEPVEHVLERLRACGCQSLPVMQGPQLVGLIAFDTVGEHIALRGARTKRA
jgi:Zn-dependent protease/CBS domain-containing protein